MRRLLTTPTTLYTSTHPWPKGSAEIRTCSAAPTLFPEHTQQGMAWQNLFVPPCTNPMVGGEGLASGKPFHSSLISSPSCHMLAPSLLLLVKSISLPWRSILYAVHQKISTNLGSEWSVCYSLQHVCFHWVRFHFQFELTLESQVQDTWTLTFPLFHVYDTHISHLEENWPYL